MCARDRLLHKEWQDSWKPSLSSWGFSSGPRLIASTPSPGKQKPSSHMDPLSWEEIYLTTSCYQSLPFESLSITPFNSAPIFLNLHSILPAKYKIFPCYYICTDVLAPRDFFFSHLFVWRPRPLTVLPVPQSSSGCNTRPEHSFQGLPAQFPGGWSWVKGNVLISFLLFGDGCTTKKSISLFVKS